MVAAITAWTLVVWLGRHGRYWPDELAWFALSPGLDLAGLFDPHYYLFLRMLHPLVTIAAVGLFCVYARRRVGSLAALTIPPDATARPWVVAAGDGLSAICVGAGSPGLGGNH